jgi:hypothetical protein
MATTFALSGAEAKRSRRASSPRSSPMPAQSVDPRIDEQREHEAVEGAAHEDPG